MMEQDKELVLSVDGGLPLRSNGRPTAVESRCVILREKGIYLSSCNAYGALLRLRRPTVVFVSPSLPARTRPWSSGRSESLK